MFSWGKCGNSGSSLSRISALGVDGRVLAFFLKCPRKGVAFVVGLQDQYFS